jgi:division protein CdvB (Snf7/Vps24/ESCRT-III family)
VAAFSMFKRLGEKIKPTPLKERIAQAMYRLEEQREKLGHMASKLQQRDKEMFHRCISAQLAKDEGHAKVYANECAEIRKIAKIVLTSQLALERVILRLQTIESFGEVLVHVAPVIDVVKETKGRISGVVPEVATELDKINSVLQDMSLEAGEVEDHPITADSISEEATHVLKESGIVAEEMMKERFPEPKVDDDKNKLGRFIVVPEGGNGGELEELVYGYLRDHNGKMSISDCAKELGSSTYMVKKAVNKLAKEGRIDLNQ